MDRKQRVNMKFCFKL